jgi:hypothetical protein
MAAIPAPSERKPLAEMTAQERADWYASQQAELEDFCSYAQSWMKGRAGRNIHTRNDERYQHFLDKAADLIAGLEELRQEAAAQAAAQATEEPER